MASNVYHPTRLVGKPPEGAWLSGAALADEHHLRHGSFPAQYHTKQDIWQGNSGEIAAVLHRRAQAETVTERMPVSRSRRRHKLMDKPHHLFKLPFRYRLFLAVWKKPSIVEQRVAQIIRPPTPSSTSGFLLDRVPYPTQKQRMAAERDG